MTSTDQHTIASPALHQLINNLPVPLVSRPSFRPVTDFTLWLRHGAGRIHRLPAEQLLIDLAAGEYDTEETMHAVWRLRHLMQKAARDAEYREAVAA